VYFLSYKKAGVAEWTVAENDVRGSDMTAKNHPTRHNQRNKAIALIVWCFAFFAIIILLLTVAVALRTASGRALSLLFSVATKHFVPAERLSFIT